MDVSSVSVLWYKRCKPVGKVRRRVQDLRVPASSVDCSATRPALDLSHNESARLAVDCLLSRGMEGYHETLNAEGEVDFLSELDKSYILENGTDGNTDDPGACDEKDFESVSAASCSTWPTDTDPTAADVRGKDSALARPSVEIYFQCGSKAAGLKDLVRELIRKATVALAIVMDTFSDVELLCDLLEASRKRNVSVYLLLDRLNLNLFVSTWQELKLNSNDFPKLSVRSANGQTYCAKSGRKLSGELAENLIIADWSEVLTGSFSFSWLSWQVHRSLGVRVKGSAVAPFREEFHRLYFGSTPVPGFVAFISLTHYNSCSSESTGQRAGSEDARARTPESPEPSRGRNQQQHSKPPGVGISTLRHVEANQSLGQTRVWNIQSQLVGLNLSTIAEKNAKIRDPPHRPARYQSTLNHLSENPKRLVPSQLFSQSGQRPAGFDPKASPPGPKQRCQPRATTDGHGLKLTPRAEGANVAARLHLQPHASQQAKPPPPLNWSRTARTRPVARTGSFDATGQTAAGLLAWRSSQRNMMSLGRSRSLTERLHPNITTI